jgi:Tfp pilus assembly ATPase PilU
MQTLDQALEALVSRGIINRLEASRRAVDKRMFQQ